MTDDKEPEPRECPEDMREGFACCLASDGYMHYWIDGVEMDEKSWEQHRKLREVRFKAKIDE